MLIKIKLKIFEGNVKKNKNVDIGCMQINYRYHGHMFENLDQILSPEYNVNYAANLQTLFKDTNLGMKQFPDITHQSQKKKKYLIKVKISWIVLDKKSQPRPNQSNKKELNF